MSRNRYFKYNPETLTYERVYPSRKYFFIDLIKKFMIFFIFSLLISILFVNIGDFFYSNKILKKSTIKESISQLIENGGELTEVRYLFKDFLSNPTEEFTIFNKNKNESYSLNVTLYDVLMDIKTSYYINGVLDTIFINRLDRIIYANNEINPFDKLSSTQKCFFENLRIKLKDEFINVSSDVNQISNELDYSNQLIDKYLRYSSLSLIVSIIAIFFSVVAFIIQFSMNIKHTKINKELINEIKDTEKIKLSITD